MNHPTKTASSAKILGLATACFYVLFTIIPDSHSLMVTWPMVLLWQIGLLSPLIWLLWLMWHKRKFPHLGNGLDWFIALILIGLAISTIFAQFPPQAFWYSWAALGFIAAIYALNYFLDTPQGRYQILLGQGYLSLVFIIISLGLWLNQALIPELQRLNQLNQLGVNLSFSFSTEELQNWVPLGHQNYVAGYLILSLPLLVALTIIQTGWRRWLMSVGVILGLIDLYTTYSRGGWLALIILVILAVIIALKLKGISGYWLGLAGLGTLAMAIVLGLANSRLRNLVTGLLNGEVNQQLGYRIINIIIGWQMGIEHLFSGIGLGGVPLLYQRYRPSWAGQQSELAFQLHSTPFQLWAEMGIWGILPVVGAIALLVYHFWRWLMQEKTHKNDEILVLSVFAGLLAYGVISLIDYQLDNLAISGTLVIYFTCVVASFPRQPHPNLPYPKAIVGSGIGIILAAIIWLIPVHRAWAMSHLGFTALYQDDIEGFVSNLTKAHELVPWEPYYPFQLGWNLGNLSLTNPDPELYTEAVNWLNKGIALSPYQEFGYNTLAWLQLRRNPEAAMINFAHALQLLPAKRGLFYGLGLSLLAQGKTDLGIEAMTIEAIRDPVAITSPIWRDPQSQLLYQQITTGMATYYQRLLTQDNQNPLWHHLQGWLSWWLGDYPTARIHLETHSNIVNQVLLELSTENLQTVTDKLLEMAVSPAKFAITAWLNSDQRLELLESAILTTKIAAIPLEIIPKIVESMEKSSNFSSWLHQYAPGLQYRRQRVAFGIVSRHLDGPAPLDFALLYDNVPMSYWFINSLPYWKDYLPLDIALEPKREDLLSKILNEK